jgi:hypothetical protein
MKLAIILATIATPALAAIDVDANQDDGCSGCTNEPANQPDPAPSPTPAPSDMSDTGDFMRPDETGEWITGPIDWSCRNGPICEGGRR